MSIQPDQPALVGLEEGRIAVFGNGPEAPSKRLFAEWKGKLSQLLKTLSALEQGGTR